MKDTNNIKKQTLINKDVMKRNFVRQTTVIWGAT